MSPMIILMAVLLAQVATGTLILQTEVGASINWDGVPLGTVKAAGSMEIRNIPPGTYRVVVSREGFESRDLEVDVASGLQTEQVRLQPLTAASRSTAEKSESPGVALRRDPEPQRAWEPSGLPGGEELEMPVEERLERSSSVAETSRLETPLLWYLLVGAFLAAMIYGVARSSRRAAEHQPGNRALNLPGFPREIQIYSSGTFLEILRQREAQMKDGEEVVQPEDSPTIEVDPASIREVDE